MTAWFRALAAVPFVLVLAACDKAALGNRCESNNDCADNALCLNFAPPHLSCTSGDCICCPGAGSSATAPAMCLTTNAAADASPGAEPGPEASTPDAPPPDAGTDATPETSAMDVNAANDASNDLGVTRDATSAD